MTINLSQERQKDAIKSIQTFFRQERDEEISEFQASLLFNFILSDIGVSIYNQALADAYQLISEKIEDIYGLEKQSTCKIRP